MAGKEFTTQSGAKLFVTQAPFEQAVALNKAVIKAMLDSGLFGKPGPEVTMRLFIDQSVADAYAPCASSATYNGRKLDAALFDDPKVGEQASRDMLEIFDTIVAYNSRFFPTASSASKAQSPAA